MLKMIDSAIAEYAQSQIAVGDVVSIWIDGVKSERKVLAKSFFSLTIDGVTNKLIVPIEFSDIYRTKEHEEMARIPLPENPAGARKRGRPPVTGPQAPVDIRPVVTAPQHEWLPPGSPSVPSGSQPGEYPVVPYSPPTPTEQPHPEQTYDPNLLETEDDIDGKPTLMVTPMQSATDVDILAWAQVEIDNVLEQFKHELTTIAETIHSHNTPALPLPDYEKFPKKKTCADCEHLDFSNGGLCGLYKMVVPVMVVLNAQEKCKDFKEDNIPF